MDGWYTKRTIVDIEKCYKKQVEIMSKNTGIETDLCGKCFAVCTYTKRYLKDTTLFGQADIGGM